MSFNTALSGLKAAAADLGVIANNVANASTTGFKQSRAEFADVYAVSSSGTSSNAIGSGVRLASVSQQFTQGTISYTDANLDLAINGDGFFVLEDNGSRIFSRAGSFQVDRDGYVVNNLAQRLIGYQADSTGAITGATGDLQLDTSNIQPNATETIDVSVNLDAEDTVPGNTIATTTITISSGDIDDSGLANTYLGETIVDSYGYEHTLDVTLTATGNPDEYDVTYDIDGLGLAPAAQTITIGGNEIFNLDFTGIATNIMGAPDLTIDLNFSNITQTSPVASIPNVGTDGVDKFTLAFDPSEPTSYNDSTSLTVYDSQGSSHLLTTYYRKLLEPNKWEVHHYVDGNAVYPNNNSDEIFVAEFSPGGNISQLWTRDDSSQPLQPAAPDSALSTLQFIMTGIDVDTPGNDVDLLDLSIDVNSLTQYGAPFSVFALSQDGYATGRLAGVDISDTGIVFARYSNGQSQALGQVALASFANSNGLRQVGDTNWSESYDSGAALVGTPGTSNLGLIQGGALEDSNVDLSGQLVKMITAQRNYQANAQVISTNDQITQTIINIR